MASKNVDPAIVHQWSWICGINGLNDRVMAVTVSTLLSTPIIARSTWELMLPNFSKDRRAFMVKTWVERRVLKGIIIMPSLEQPG